MNKNHLLIIEDTEIDIFVAARVAQLLNENVVVSSFNEPDSALEYLYGCEENCWPELILLDLRFPRKNGFYFMDEWMKFPNDLRAKTRILILSASLDNEEIESALAHPATAGMIAKPLTRESFSEYSESWKY